MKRSLVKVCNEADKFSQRAEKASRKRDKSLESAKTFTFSGQLDKCPVSVVALDRVLPAGQAFRWKKITAQSNNSSPCIWRGVIGNIVFDLSQQDSKITVLARSSSHKVVSKPSNVDPIEMLRSYFNLHIDYGKFLEGWQSKDENFRNCDLDCNGARVLAVDPTEALFSYICSSNNNIPRISKMVNNLAEFYGEKIGTVESVDYYTFPKPEDLAADDVEKKLRAAGFGYRAGFIVKTAKRLTELGGESWLRQLKEPSVPYSDAAEKLLELPGVGRKVADCVCLVGLGKFESVPIDTHVFQVANKLYKIPCLTAKKKESAGKKTKVALSASMYHEIGDFFRSLWGSHAGWAQQILFTHRVMDRQR